VTSAAGTDVPWELVVASASPVDRVEIMVNGQVAWSGEGLKAAGLQTHRGTIKAPAGGWIAARVQGGTTEWPAMDSYPFAHTAPLWFGSPGSTDPAAASRAASDLLAALTVAEARVKQSYGETDTPVLLGRIAQARQKLQGLVR
jgi:TolB protein